MRFKNLYRFLKPLDDGSDLGGADDTAVVDRGDTLRVDDHDDAGEAAAAAAEAAAAAAAAAEEGGDEDEDEVPAAKTAGKKDSRIPLSRHKEILTKEREHRAQVEAQLAQYQQGQQVAKLGADLSKVEDTVLGMEKEYTKLLADGELEKATALLGRIRVAERQMNDAKAEVRLQAAISQATEAARYNVTLERVEEAYPTLNPDHDDFDRESMLEVVEWKAFYESRKNGPLPPAAALQAAVKKVMGKPETRAESRATEVTAKVDAKDVTAERKKAAVGKALATDKKTPPNVANVGLDSDKAGAKGKFSPEDVMKMSQDDFNKLPDDVLAKMRGDVV